MPWLSMSAAANLSSRLDVVSEVLDERHDDVERRDVRSRSVGDDLHQPQVVDVLVGQDDQLDVGRSTRPRSAS